MLTLNTLLRCEGIEPATVRLVRHQDTTYPGRTPYDLWRADDGRFERYQSLQNSAVNFGVGHLLASFVATPASETLFVGLFTVEGRQDAPPGTMCPIRQTSKRINAKLRDAPPGWCGHRRCRRPLGRMDRLGSRPPGC